MSALLLLMSTSALAQVAGGTLVVNVPNAPGELMLDGFPTGQSPPATLENVAPGTHLVQMEFGCMVGEKEVTVVADKTTKLTLPMQYKGGTGTIRLKGLPYTATVLVDDAPIRSWAEGVEAKCGSRTLVVESPGFQDWTADTIITSGKWVTVQVSMIESEIQESAPAPRPSARPVDDFEDEDDFELDELDSAYSDEDRGRRNDRDEEDFGEDDYDSLDEPAPSSSSSRDKEKAKELERRRLEQEQRRQVEVERRRQEEAEKQAAEDRKRAEAAERRRAAEEARRRQEEAERRSRYGDIDSLDEGESDGEERDALEEDDDYDEFEEEDDDRGRDRYDDEDEDLDDEFDDEDSDRIEQADEYDEYDEYDELDSDSGGRTKEPREAREPRAPRASGGGPLEGKVLKLGGTGGLAAVAIGGAIYSGINAYQYSRGRGYWEDIVAATGIGSTQEIGYWEAYVQPYKNRAIAGAAVGAVGLVGAGAWFFVAPDGTVHVGYSRRF